MTEPPPPGDIEAPPRQSHPPLPVLYCDDDIIAVSKPSGLLVHRDDRYPEAPAVLQTVRDQTGRFLYPVHRLDRGTSGILLFAFASATAARLQKCLQADSARKLYLALVRYPGRGRELGQHWICEQPLADDKEVLRAARSTCEVRETFRGCALIEVGIHTGRYHQIRRHLALCGRPIAGDAVHGRDRFNQLLRRRHDLQRLFLHQHRLLLRHPRTAAPIELEDPLPPELTAVLAALRARRT